MGPSGQDRTGLIGQVKAVHERNRFIFCDEIAAMQQKPMQIARTGRSNVSSGGLHVGEEKVIQGSARLEPAACRTAVMHHPLAASTEDTSPGASTSPASCLGGVPWMAS